MVNRRIKSNQIGRGGKLRARTPKSLGPKTGRMVNISPLGKDPNGEDG